MPLRRPDGLETLVIIMVANKYAFLQITRRRFLNEWEAFKKVISRRNIRRRITIPLTLSNLKLLRRITRTENMLVRSEERFSRNAETELVCRLLLEKKNFAGAERPIVIRDPACVFPYHDDHRDLHSFPTRRSSDLTSLKWLETNNLFNNLIQRNQSAAFSSGKVRPNHETNINIIARRTGKDVYVG